MNFIKKKVISIRNVIFNKNKYWNKKRIQYFTKDMKKLYNAIEVVEAL